MFGGPSSLAHGLDVDHVSRQDERIRAANLSPVTSLQNEHSGAYVSMRKAAAVRIFAGAVLTTDGGTK